MEELERRIKSFFDIPIEVKIELVKKIGIVIKIFKDGKFVDGIYCDLRNMEETFAYYIPKIREKLLAMEKISILKREAERNNLELEYWRTKKEFEKVRSELWIT